MEQLTLRWHGHACFSLTCRDFTVVLDPYADHYVRGLSPLRLAADLVLCSHTQHDDHNAAGLVSPRTGHANPFRVTEIPTFHDPEGGRLRGKNTIHLLEAGGLRVAHMGDSRHTGPASAGGGCHPGNSPAPRRRCGRAGRGGPVPPIIVPDSKSSCCPPVDWGLELY